MADDISRLQFVGSTRLRCDRTSLRDWEVRTLTGRFLGRLAGVLADAAAQTIRYFVVERSDFVGPRHRLISFCPVRVDREACALLLQLGDMGFAHLEALEARDRRDLMDDGEDGNVEPGDDDLAPSHAPAIQRRTQWW